MMAPCGADGVLRLGRLGSFAAASSLKKRRGNAVGTARVNGPPGTPETAGAMGGFGPPGRAERIQGSGPG